MKKFFGVLFLLGSAACDFFAYVNGGPAWGERFDLHRMLRQGGLWPVLGGLVCLVVGLLMLFGKNGKDRPNDPA